MLAQKASAPDTLQSASFSFHGHSTSAVLHDTVSLSGYDVEGSSEIWGEKRIVIPKILNETYQIKITKLLVNPTNFMA